MDTRYAEKKSDHAQSEYPTKRGRKKRPRVIGKSAPIEVKDGAYEQNSKIERYPAVAETVRDHSVSTDPGPVCSDGAGQPANDNRQRRTESWPADYREQFWSPYPKKDGKKPALQKLDEIYREDKVEFSRILDGLRRYVSKTDDRPWMNPFTFLDQERWEDQGVTQKSRTKYRRTVAI